MQPPRHGGDSWRLTEGEEGVCVIQILPTTPLPSHIQHHQPSTPLSIRPYQQSGHQNPFTPPTNTPRGSNGAVGYRGDLSEVMNKSRPMSQERVYTNQHRTPTQGDRYRCFDIIKTKVQSAPDLDLSFVLCDQLLLSGSWKISHVLPRGEDSFY